MERVAIFIDGSNLYKGLVASLGADYRLNFVQFIQALAGGRKLLRAYYYNAPLPPEDPASRAHQGFLNYLKRVPYVAVRLGRLERRGEGFVEKGVDIQIAVDMLKLAYNDAYDVAVLVSGDGDFADAIKVIQDLGKQVENATFTSLSSQRLSQQSDRFIPLEALAWDQLRSRPHETFDEHVYAQD